jgi:hypothetical protein
MAWIPKEKEIAALLIADEQRRYEYFLRRVSETRAVWSLRSDGRASWGDEGGQRLIPFWPHAAFAQRCATGAWQDFQPAEIGLDVFLDRWIPGLKTEGIAPAIFPVPSGSTVIVTLETLAAALRHELGGE